LVFGLETLTFQEQAGGFGQVAGLVECIGEDGASHQSLEGVSTTVGKIECPTGGGDARC
jgi:hypothetical protein